MASAAVGFQAPSQHVGYVTDGRSYSPSANFPEYNDLHTSAASGADGPDLTKSNPVGNFDAPYSRPRPFSQLVSKRLSWDRSSSRTSSASRPAIASRTASISSPTHQPMYDPIVVARRSSSNGSGASPSNKASHGKLHKRPSSKASLQASRSSEHSDRSLPSFTHASTPPIIAEGIVASATFPLPQSSPSKNRKTKRNSHRLSSKKHNEDHTDEIDLSRTAAENEEMSGLGITATALRSSLEGDYTRNVRHGRSFSHSSNGSNGISFKPSAPYVHPVHQQSKPSSTTEPYMTSDSFTMYSSIYAGSQSYLSSGSETTMTPRTRTTSSSSVVHRPPLRLNTSTSSSGKLTTLSHLSDQVPAPVSTTAFHMTRRDTMQSNTEAGNTPISRTSLERAFSIRREPIDEATRQATIQAARRAFDDREEAKARKRSEQQRKAEERERRRIARQEEKNVRRKSASAFESPSALHGEYIDDDGVDGDAEAEDGGAHGVLGDLLDNEIHHEEAPYSDSEALPVRRSRTRSRRGELPTVFARDPPVSRKRRAKGVAIGMMTWCRVQMLKMSR